MRQRQKPLPILRMWPLCKSCQRPLLALQGIWVCDRCPIAQAARAAVPRPYVSPLAQVRKAA